MPTHTASRHCITRVLTSRSFRFDCPTSGADDTGADVTLTVTGLNFNDSDGSCLLHVNHNWQPVVSQTASSVVVVDFLPLSSSTLYRSLTLYSYHTLRL